MHAYVKYDVHEHVNFTTCLKEIILVHPSRVPLATTKQLHRLVSFSLPHTNAIGRYRYRTETFIKVTECEHDRYWALQLQSKVAHGRCRNRILQVIHATADRCYRYKTLQLSYLFEYNGLLLPIHPSF